MPALIPYLSPDAIAARSTARTSLTTHQLPNLTCHQPLKLTDPYIDPHSLSSSPEPTPDFTAATSSVAGPHRTSSDLESTLVRLVVSSTSFPPTSPRPSHRRLAGIASAVKRRRPRATLQRLNSFRGAD